MCKFFANGLAAKPWRKLAGRFNIQRIKNLSRLSDVNCINCSTLAPIQYSVYQHVFHEYANLVKKLINFERRLVQNGISNSNVAVTRLILFIIAMSKRLSGFFCMIFFHSLSRRDALQIFICRVVVTDNMHFLTLLLNGRVFTKFSLRN